MRRGSGAPGAAQRRPAAPREERLGPGREEGAAPRASD